MKVRIYKDKNGDLYVKTGREKGFMTRLYNGTRHDGTTMGDFKLVCIVVIPSV